MKSVCILLLLPVLTISCRKEDTPHPPAIATGTRIQLSLDSLYLYAKETYLWYDALPDYQHFAPRQYEGAGTGTAIADLRQALNAITRHAIDPVSQRPFEYPAGNEQPLYSYISEGNIITGKRAESPLGGKGNDMGLGMAVTQHNTVYVSYVLAGSPAADAGIKRGMKVLHIDEVDVPLNSSIIAMLLSGPSMGVTVQAKDGPSYHVVLHKREYTTSPVLQSTILNTGQKQIGYLALANFSLLTHAKLPIDAAFDLFANAAVDQLIVDLRYNNGGYVETAEYVANLLAPGRLHGAVMYEEHYNTLLQQGRAPILNAIPYLDMQGNPVYIQGRAATYADVDFSVARNTYRFSKTGRLTGVRQIVFIVSGITASASEMLINCFKPYLDVKLVGSKTYGKPVGYFGIGIDVFTVYLAQFRILNANRQGDYYQGMPVDIAANDDITQDFGTPGEAAISQALAYLAASAEEKREARQTVAPGSYPAAHAGLSAPAIMTEYRLPLK